MFDNLTDRLQGVLQKVKGEDKLTAESVDASLAEVRKALIEADVSLKVVKLFLNRVRKAAVGERIVKGVTPSQKFIQIVNDELVQLLGGHSEPLDLTAQPSVIMLLGLQGAGKTTTAAKLALKLKKEGKKTLLAALDLQRPSAIEQLSILAEQIEVEIVKDETNKDVLDVAAKAWMKAQDENYDVVIFDTAGRLQIDNELMAELLLLDRKYQPKEKLLVLDSLIGQEAVNVAEAFNTQIGITGSILTKMDGDARGGAALSLVESTGTKVKFLGLGEKIEPLEDFDPERIASRVLGFGDVIALVKKAEDAFDKEETAALEKKLQRGELTFESFLQMQRMMSKLGSLSQIFNLMGLNNALQLNKEQREQLFEEGQQKLKLYEYAIQSMTKLERKDPDLINQNRIRRISKGSGLKEKQVDHLIKEFGQMRGVVKMMGSFGGGKQVGSSPNPQDLAMMMKKSNKMQKKEKKKGGGPFGGGAFLKF
ncbi:MAG: signal recognition particle protein [Candidatus Caenarcaniphilales bacterium]|nr:signal recognition particle protein [Candidatus Caenarcaniphilales bacterium]